MINNLKVKYFMVSYSNESIISKEDLFNLLSKYGSVKVYEIDHKRMVMGSIGKSTAGNKVTKDNPNVTEYIFVLDKFYLISEEIKEIENAV
jgi:adenine-specific DNA methylase